MAEAPRDFVELFRCLNAHKVQYVIVGGYAVAFYGFPRFTGDLDLFLNPSKENADHVLEALEAFGFGGLGLSAEDFSDKDHIVSLGYPPERVDLVCDIEGLDWPEVWNRRFAGSFGGVETFFISKSDLLKYKRLSDRAQDHVDADMLDMEKLNKDPPPLSSL